MIPLPLIIDSTDKSSQLANCIRNNYRHLRKYFQKHTTNAFRIYDRDIKEYPLAIDYYAGRFAVHFFLDRKDEGEIDPENQEEVKEVLIKLFGIEEDQIFWRNRIRRRKMEQYEKEASSEDFFVVYEHGVQFEVNLEDYLDTGLFLDHRQTRQIVAKQASKKRLLNLFAYTCAFSVHAACQGAAFTKSVDMSNTYTNWGKENFLLNRLPLGKNEVVRADCLKFLDEERNSRLKYDLIVIDPPTISRSKKMEDLFDIQIDYLGLIDRALGLLEPQGTIFFSTNSRKFVFDQAHFPKCHIIDISKKTLPQDFRDPKIHRCWKITLI
jgi:23S rRNA (cytosine1962-C5)-methyltransferase